ncbi:hypothetical protein MED121_15839 [Marinomonas sp. MED121]|nr:hypothetical protein MED121_15839 [Marinomonas sp. MED121]
MKRILIFKCAFFIKKNALFKINFKKVKKSKILKK